MGEAVVPRTLGHDAAHRSLLPWCRVSDATRAVVTCPWAVGRELWDGVVMRVA